MLENTLRIAIVIRMELLEDMFKVRCLEDHSWNETQHSSKLSNFKPWVLNLVDLFELFRVLGFDFSVFGYSNQILERTRYRVCPNLFQRTPQSMCLYWSCIKCNPCSTQSKPSRSFAFLHWESGKPFNI
ncbi:hypothetical protein AAZX31_06G069800 [Glycine max]